MTENSNFSFSHMNPSRDRLIHRILKQGSCRNTLYNISMSINSGEKRSALKNSILKMYMAMLIMKKNIIQISNKVRIRSNGFIISDKFHFQFHLTDK